MQRTVITPADLSGEALEHLKEWLGISRSGEDALLTDLLSASLALCEGFTGQTPIEQSVEEQFEPIAGEYRLRSLPVRSLVSVETVGNDGARTALAASDYEFRIDSCARAFLDLSAEQNGRSVAVTVRVGLSADWGSLPRALRQGAIRLSAFQYRDRDGQGAASPPASVTALWRPWRTLRVA